MITKFFKFSKLRNEKSFSNIAVGEACGTCPPETSGGYELKRAGIVALLAGRDGCSLVRTETTRWSAGRRCRVAAEPLTPETLCERVGNKPDDNGQRHRNETRIAVPEDEAPDSSKSHPLQNDGNPVREDGQEAVAEKAPEDPTGPRNPVELHFAQGVENDRGDRQNPYGDNERVHIPPREEDVGHRHHEADHEVEQQHEDRYRTARQLPGEVPDLLSHFHFVSPFLWL